jgi:hypothetical protein
MGWGWVCVWLSVFLWLLGLLLLKLFLLVLLLLLWMLLSTSWLLVWVCADGAVFVSGCN